MNSPIIRPATITDLNQLVNLNARWQKANLSSNQNGFLSGRFDDATFRTIIDLQDIVVLADGDTIGAYYLVNNDAESPILAYLISNINELKTKGIIKQNANVGIGTQVVIDTDYQGKGFRKQLLDALILQVRNRIDVLFSSISKQNLKSQKANIADGWKIVDENESVYFVMIETKA